MQNTKCQIQNTTQNTIHTYIRYIKSYVTVIYIHDRLLITNKISSCANWQLWSTSWLVHHTILSGPVRAFGWSGTVGTFNHASWQQALPQRKLRVLGPILSHTKAPPIAFHKHLSNRSNRAQWVNHQASAATAVAIGMFQNVDFCIISSKPQPWPPGPKDDKGNSHEKVAWTQDAKGVCSCPSQLEFSTCTQKLCHNKGACDIGNTLAGIISAGLWHPKISIRTIPRISAVSGIHHHTASVSTDLKELLHGATWHETRCIAWL